jgi:hypothetical protein
MLDNLWSAAYHKFAQHLLCWGACFKFVHCPISPSNVFGCVTARRRSQDGEAG